MIFIIFLVIKINFSLKNTTFYVGENYETNETFAIQALPDFIFNSTVISSNDFKCIDENKCEILSEEKTFSYQNRPIKYKEAKINLNIIKQPFEKRLKVKYLE